MGLAACPRASFAWVASGREWKALLRTCSANVPGTGRVGIGPQRPSVVYRALRSGIPKGAINAAWDAIGEVIKAWATEGHSVAVPGLGTMRLASPSLLRHGIAQASLALRMAQTQPSVCARRAWAT